MNLGKLRCWWRGLPTKTRVKWIASAFLVFAGAEVFVLTPFIVDLAILIDAFGVIFVLGAAKASLGATFSQLWTRFRSMLHGLLRTLDGFADFGLKLPASWLLRYMLADALAARIAVGASAMVVCLALFRQFMTSLL